MNVHDAPNVSPSLLVTPHSRLEQDMDDCCAATLLLFTV